MEIQDTKPSWIAISGDLIHMVKDHFSMIVHEDSSFKEDFINKINDLQKAVLKKEDHMARTFGTADELIKSAELKQHQAEESLNEVRSYYQSQLDDLRDKYSRSQSERARYKKKYGRSYRLIIELTKLMAEHENQEENNF